MMETMLIYPALHCRTPLPAIVILIEYTHPHMMLIKNTSYGGGNSKAVNKMDPLWGSSVSVPSNAIFLIFFLGKIRDS
jgi:hypothetical protein